MRCRNGRKQMMLRASPFPNVPFQARSYQGKETAPCMHLVLFSGQIVDVEKVLAHIKSQADPRRRIEPITTVVSQVLNAVKWPLPRDVRFNTPNYTADSK